MNYSQNIYKRKTQIYISIFIAILLLLGLINILPPIFNIILKDFDILKTPELTIPYIQGSNSFLTSSEIKEEKFSEKFFNSSTKIYEPNVEEIIFKYKSNGFNYISQLDNKNNLNVLYIIPNNAENIHFYTDRSISYTKDNIVIGKNSIKETFSLDISKPNFTDIVYSSILGKFLSNYPGENSIYTLNNASTLDLLVNITNNYKFNDFYKLTDESIFIKSSNKCYKINYLNLEQTIVDCNESGVKIINKRDFLFDGNSKITFNSDDYPFIEYKSTNSKNYPILFITKGGEYKELYKLSYFNNQTKTIIEKGYIKEIPKNIDGVYFIDTNIYLIGSDFIYLVSNITLPISYTKDVVPAPNIINIELKEVITDTKSISDLTAF